MTDRSATVDPAIAVLLVDADARRREGRRLLIDSQPDIRVALEADDGGDAVTLLRTNEVDVLVADLLIPGIDGVRIAELAGVDARIRLSHRARPPRIVLLTGTDLDRATAPAAAAGADAVLYSDAPPDDLLAAIRAAASRRVRID